MEESDSGQSGAYQVKVALSVWIAILAVSAIIPFFIAPTGSSFTRGLNRLEPSLWLQLFGFLVAAWSARTTLRCRASLPKSLGVFGFVPLGLYLIAGLLLIGLVASA
jgi:hypothetical protein